MTPTPLRTVAHRFFAALLETASQARVAGRITPQVRVEAYWNFPNFKYGPNGPDTGGGSGVPREIPDWTKAIGELLSQTRTTIEYRELVAEIEVSTRPEGLASASFVDSMSQAFLTRVLVNPPPEGDLVGEAAETLELQLGRHPIPMKMGVRVIGITIADTPLHWRHRDLDMTIRHTERSDVERPVSAPFGMPVVLAADSIAVIRLMGRPFVDAQIQEQRLISVLRLFSGAPVGSLGTELEAFPWGQSSGFSFGGQPRLAWRKRALGASDQRRLQLFWERLAELLPNPFSPHPPAQADAVYVALERFNDALDSGSVFERSVTSAVMGLEALYLKPTGEQAELTYRLCNRAARALAYLGYKPEQTKEIIDLAYDVRSGYVHGGRASLRDKRKIERLYGSLVDFQVALIDLLRVSIIAGLTRPLEKEEFIEALDDALIDPNRGSKLEGLMSEAKRLQADTSAPPA